jgi:MFS family permease
MADYEKKDEKETSTQVPDLERRSSEESIQKGDLLSLEHVDPALNAKMHLVNDTIDEIGFTRYQWKLFFLNGFGYAVDSLILLIQSIIAPYAEAEFHPSFAYGMTVAVYVGMLVGALFWGLSADVIGRKYAFNFSLLISSVFCIVAGASPNWIVLGLFVSLAAFGSGGNLVLDTTVFLEYLPSQDQWLLTLMACWWGGGQFVAGLWAWAFLPNYSCPAALGSTTGKDLPCNWNTNPGWRYVWFACGAIVLVMSLARVTVINLRETPKFLVGEGKDAEVVDTLQYIAKRYNRPCSLTLEQMQACGATGGALPAGRRGSVSAHAAKKFSFNEVWMHLKGLFATRKLGLSTALIWWSWTLIGLAYPLYVVCSARSCGRRGLMKMQVQRLLAHLSPNAWRTTRRPEPWKAMAVLCGSKLEFHSLPNPRRFHVQEPLVLGSSRHHDHWRHNHHGFLLRLYAGAE